MNRTKLTALDILSYC